VSRLKPCAFTHQSLRDHSRGSSKIATQYCGPNYLQTSVRRLRTAGYCIIEDDLRKGIILATLLHDFGKALPRYQSQFDNKCNCICDTAPAFYLHELFSVAIARRVCRGLRLDDKLTFLITVAVLQHLHSMRSLGNSLSLGNLPNLLARFNAQDLALSAYKTELCAMFDEAASSLSLEMAAVPSWFEDIRKQEVVDTVKNIVMQSRLQNCKWTKLYVLVLNPVIIGDNLDSAGRISQESTNRRSFTMELEATLEDG